MLADVAHVIPIEALAARKQPVDARNLAKRHPWPGQTALGLGQESPFAVYHLDAQSASFGVRVHVVTHLLEGVLLHHSVGVQQEHMFGFGGAYGLVVGTREADVILVGNDFYPGKAFADHGHRSVHRLVVHHPYFCIHTGYCALDRIQALFQKVLDVVVDNDNGKFHPRGSAFSYGTRWAMERPRVTSSAYSNSPPTDTPRAMVVTDTSKGASLR